MFLPTFNVSYRHYESLCPCQSTSTSLQDANTLERTSASLARGGFTHVIQTMSSVFSLRQCRIQQSYKRAPSIFKIVNSSFGVLACCIVLFKCPCSTCFFMSRLPISFVFIISCCNASLYIERVT